MGFSLFPVLTHTAHYNPNCSILLRKIQLAENDDQNLKHE
jgi:hypothetical protein